MNGDCWRIQQSGVVNVFTIVGWLICRVCDLVPCLCPSACIPQLSHFLFKLFSLCTVLGSVLLCQGLELLVGGGGGGVGAVDVLLKLWEVQTDGKIYLHVLQQGELPVGCLGRFLLLRGQLDQEALLVRHQAGHLL